MFIVVVFLVFSGEVCNRLYKSVVGDNFPFSLCYAFCNVRNVGNHLEIFRNENYNLFSILSLSSHSLSLHLKFISFLHSLSSSCSSPSNLAPEINQPACKTIPKLSNLLSQFPTDNSSITLYELHYSDLKLLSSGSGSGSGSSTQELERLETIKKSIMEALGPKGPGLLSICGLTNASILRRNLLPLARNLALLNPDHRNRIFKEHNLGSDVSLKNPDRNVSSFAMQLRYEQGLESTQNNASSRVGGLTDSDQDHADVDMTRHLPDYEYKNLGNTFKELGFCMMELGLRLARICDRAIGGQELEQSLLESRTAKGRLIHYHSTLDNITLKEEAGRKRGFSKKLDNHRRNWEHCMKSEQVQTKCANMDTNCHDAGFRGTHSNLWQQWHYDYGVFTVLTDPLFILSSYLPENKQEEQYALSCDQECPSPSGHTYLQIFDPNKNKVRMVKSSPESFIIQVGESADIISKGKLRSTLHCVRRPAKLENLSRETFVVFLQPAWSKTFSISDYPLENCNLDCQCSGVHDAENQLAEQDSKLTEEIRKITPPLALRLKDGMTFAEFSRETTKQYYGGGGLQPNK